MISWTLGRDFGSALKTRQPHEGRANTWSTLCIVTSSLGDVSSSLPNKKGAWVALCFLPSTLLLTFILVNNKECTF